MLGENVFYLILTRKTDRNFINNPQNPQLSCGFCFMVFHIRHLRNEINYVTV